MPTAVLDAYSNGYPFIANRIRAAVSKESDPMAIVASIIDSTAGHPARIYHFPGLPRDNYRFTLDEIDGAGAVVNNLALFNVVPSTIEGFLVRADEQIKVGTTPGLTTATNEFIFDGTETAPGSGIYKPDYRNWEIVVSECTGRGILVRDFVDFSWDKLTGTFTLLQAGDVFATGQWYNVHFEPITSPIGNSYPTVRDFKVNLIKVSTVLDQSYFGDKLLVEPDSDYIEVTLPDINTVSEGRAMMVDVYGDVMACVKFIPQGGTEIKFLRGNLIAYTNESFSIYKFNRPLGTPEWRVSDAHGSFSLCGTVVGDDMIQADVFNKQLLDGTIGDIELHARIYEEVVLNLPLAQRVNYDEWGTGNNKYLYSLANSADPGNAGKFRFPDRRGLFERNNSAGKAGDFADEAINITGLAVTINQGNSFLGNGGAGVVGRGSNSPNSWNAPVIATAGSKTGLETMPKNYLINKYVLL